MSGPWFHQPNIKAWVENCFQPALQIILFLLLHIASHLGQRISNFRVQEQPVARFFCTCDIGNLWQIFPPLCTSSISRWRNHGFLHHTGCHQHHFCFVVLRTMEVKTSLDFSRVFREWIAEHKNPQRILETEHPQMQAFCLQNAYVIFFPVIPRGYLPDTNWIILTPCFQRLLYNSNQIPTRYHRKKIKIIQSKQSLCSYSPWTQALLELGLWSAAQHAGPYSSKAHGIRPLFW